MPSSSGSALTLASSLRALDDERLESLVRSREVREHGVDDWFDLAERLLEPANVQAAIARLDRRALLTLRVLCDLAPVGSSVTVDAITARTSELSPVDGGFPLTVAARVQRLIEIGLAAPTDAGVVTFEAVCDLVDGTHALRLPSIEQLASATPAELGGEGRPAQDRVDAAAAEHAFAIATTVVDLFDALRAEPVRELARGGLGAPDLKRLAAATDLAPERVTTLLALCRRAGFIVLAGGSWRPADFADGWSDLPVAERWVELATAWSRVMGDDARFFMGDRIPATWGAHLLDYLHWFYPAADERFRAEIDDYIRSAELLGILALHTPTTPGTAAVRLDAEAALASMRALLPADVEQVYLQNDLSVIAAGPLQTAVHERLRTMATLEARGIASTYRISDASLTVALDHGETEESVLAFLERISLTGVPQPVRFLVAEAAGRYGLIRVGAVRDSPTAARVGYARSTDAVLLETLLVDRRLSALGLRSDGEGRATSRFDRDVLYTALRDARYPVAAEDAGGALVPPPRASSPRPGAAHVPPPDVDHAAIIVGRLRANPTGPDDATAWLERQLELAVKSRLRVAVSVRGTDGTVEEHLLEPTALASGRLRARDRRAGIERTLPLSRITAVREVDGA